MTLPEIHTIVVCGAGTMGSGIAETAARSGYQTILFDPYDAALQKARDNTARNLELLVEKEKISREEKNHTISRLSYTSDISHCVGELIIEAIIEKADAKAALFSNIASRNNANTILASNTSSLSITSIASQLPNRERVCGMHFFNPAQVMKLVEIVHTEWTDPSVTSAATAVAESMGKVAVVCKDSPGFIVNRVARHYYLESLKLLEENAADIETIDRVLENAGFRMGPFRLMDLIGNDINLAVTKSLYEACGKPERFKPSAIQEDKVERGELGRKTGKGYYHY